MIELSKGLMYHLGAPGNSPVTRENLVIPSIHTIQLLNKSIWPWFNYTPLLPPMDHTFPSLVAQKSIIKHKSWGEVASMFLCFDSVNYLLN